MRKALVNRRGRALQLAAAAGLGSLFVAASAEAQTFAISIGVRETGTAVAVGQNGGTNNIGRVFINGNLIVFRKDVNASNWTLETNTPFYGWGLAGRVETTALAVQALNRYCATPNAERIETHRRWSRETRLRGGAATGPRTHAADCRATDHCSTANGPGTKTNFTDDQICISKFSVLHTVIY